MAKLKTVDPVSEEVIIAVAQLHAENPGDDITFLMVTQLSSRFPRKELLDANFRMMALSNFLVLNKGEPWILKSPGEKYTLVNEALYRAAAITPLSYDSGVRMKDIHFDEKELMTRALSKSDVEGKA